MTENEQPIKNNPRWRRLLTAGVWSWLKERRSSDKITKTVMQRVASNPAVLGLAASATVVGAASGIGLISSEGDTKTLEKRVVILEEKLKDSEQIYGLISQLENKINDLTSKTDKNIADIQSLRADLESVRRDLEQLPIRMDELEKRLDEMIEKLRTHEHPHTHSTVPPVTTTTVPPVTTTTVPPVTTTTVPPVTTTTVPPVPTTTVTQPPSTTTTTRKETKKECLTRTTRGEERTCSPLWVWLQLRLGAWLD